MINMQLHRSIRYLALLAAMLVAILCTGQAAPQSTCIDCHSAMEKPYQVTAEQFAVDIHAVKGLTCASCHGGDPKSPDKAMDPKAGFRGHIDRKAIPALCSSCHSDENYIRRFNPSLRTDQLAHYRTSVHGKLLAKGDTKVAVCTDCHGVHGLRAPSDPLSRVHPLNVAKTCASCHASRDYMKSYAIPTNQFALYSTSVHQEALAVRGDLSAPTCSTCHGNHGAAPPSVSSVQNVCSTCHILQSQLFDTSVHKEMFAAAGFPSCITCHSNHAINRPNDSMIGSGSLSVCSKCHTDDDGMKAGVAIQEMLVGLQKEIDTSQQLLDRAAQSGMEVSDAQMEQQQARAALTKARVTLHSFDVKKVSVDIAVAQKIAEKNKAAAYAAIREGNFRRKGLLVSLLFIFGTLLGLRLYIGEEVTESPNSEEENER
jgi:hypothetical protein